MTLFKFALASIVLFVFKIECSAQNRYPEASGLNLFNELRESTILPKPTTAQLIPSDGLEVDLESPLILILSDSQSFRSPIFQLQMTRDTVRLFPQRSSSDFLSMAELRNDNDSNMRLELDRFGDQQGIKVSNVGVSISLTWRHEGADYAVLAYRSQKNRLMLFSGYVDQFIDAAEISSVVMANVYKELSEELIATDSHCVARSISVVETYG